MISPYKNIILTTIICTALTAGVALAAADGSAIDAAESVATQSTLRDLPLHWDSVDHPRQDKSAVKQAKAMPIIITADDVKKAEKAAAKQQNNAVAPSKPSLVVGPGPQVKPAPAKPEVTPPAPAPTIDPPKLEPVKTMPPESNKDTWVAPVTPDDEYTLEIVPLVTPEQAAPQPVVTVTEPVIVELGPIEPIQVAAPQVVPTPVVEPQVSEIVELPAIEPVAVHTSSELQLQQVNNVQSQAIASVPTATVNEGQTVELPPIERVN